MIIQVFRGNGLSTLNIEPESGSLLKRVLMGEETVTLVFSMPNYVVFSTGDYLSYQGIQYSINNLPSIKKTSSKNYQYTVVFESPTYEMLRTMFMFYDSGNALQEGIFSLTGSPQDFLTLIIKNLNRFQSGWTAGTSITGPYITISFSNESVTSAINKIAQQFGTEWYIAGQTVYLNKKSLPSSVAFSYGKGNGLYEVSRQQNSNSALVTRLYAYGGSTNIDPLTYGHNTLKMPSGAAYIESGVSTLGLFEGVQTYPTIFPQRFGVVTTASGSTPNVFTDVTIDFDINSYTIAGVTVQINVLSGLLSGYTFDLHDYVNSSQTFTINQNTNDKNIVIPSSILHLQAGDTYTILGIKMPASYISAAEASLLAAATTYLTNNALPQFTYSVAIDPLWYASGNYNFDAGSSVTLTDGDMNLITQIRVIGISINLDNTNNISLTLGNTVVPSLAERVIANTAESLNTANAAVKALQGGSISDQAARTAAAQATTAAAAASAAASGATGGASAAQATADAAQTAANQAQATANTANAAAATAASNAAVADAKAVTAQNAASVADAAAISASNAASTADANAAAAHTRAVTADNNAAAAQAAANTANAAVASIVASGGDATAAAAAAATANANAATAQATANAADAAAITAQNAANVADAKAVDARNNAATADAKAVDAKGQGIYADYQAQQAKANAATANNNAATAQATANQAQTNAAAAQQAANAAAANAAAAQQAAAIAQANLNAHITSISYITNSLQTTVLGGLITTTVLEVGPGNADGRPNAGISGAGVLPSEVRFYAGAEYANRASAPFRVQQDGTVYMYKANIQTGCTIGAFQIDSNGALIDNSLTGSISLYGNGNSVRLAAGAAGNSAAISAIAGNSQGNFYPNVALDLSAYGHPTAGYNIAMRVGSGDVIIQNGILYLNGGVLQFPLNSVPVTPGGHGYYPIYLNDSGQLCRGGRFTN